MAEKNESTKKTELTAKPTVDANPGTKPTATTPTEGTRWQPPQFIPKLKGQVVTVRMQDGRPIKGVLKGYNNYELLLEQRKGSTIILFKGAIASIE